MTDEHVDYEDLTEMQLDPAELEEWVAVGGECVFNWTNSQGYPVGVVVAYVYRHGKFWTTCAAARKRVPALRKRPQSAIVINRDRKTATYKGDSVIHAPGDPGHDELKSWFYPALSGLETDPDDEYKRSFAKFLDSEHRVIIETDPKLVVAFDVMKFRAFTNQAIQAGLGAD